MRSSSSGAWRRRGEVLGAGERHPGDVLQTVRGRARQDSHPGGHAAVGEDRRFEDLRAGNYEWNKAHLDFVLCKKNMFLVCPNSMHIEWDKIVMLKLELNK